MLYHQFNEIDIWYKKNYQFSWSSISVIVDNITITMSFLMNNIDY